MSAKAMNLEQWCQFDERIYIADMDERYKQHAGLDHSEHVIEQLAEMRAISAKTFLDSFSQPRAIPELARNHRTFIDDKAGAQIIESAQSKDCFSTSSLWKNSSQLEHMEAVQQRPKRSGKTKASIDEFLSKTRHISPVIKERFDHMKQVYHEYLGKKFSPLDGYLENERISHSHLIDFVKSMGREARKPFQEALATISKKVLGRNAE